MFRKNKKLNLNQGFTLIEMMIYLFLMTLITIVVVQSLVIVLKSNRGAFAESNIRNAGYGAMEGMIREIHASDSIATTSNGILQMNQSNPTNVVQFSTSSDSKLNFYQGVSTSSLTLTGPLTSKNILVKSLIFTPINTGKSFAVKIQMKLETTVDGQTKNAWFYDTATLKGSY